MSTLQLILELRARQLAIMQAKIHERTKSQSIYATTLLDTLKSANSRISLQDGSAIALHSIGRTCTDPKFSMSISGTAIHASSTKVPQLVSNRLLTASFAPARAKRRSLNTGKENRKAATKECYELQNSEKSDKCNSKWLEFYDILKDYQKRQGHCIVPRNCEIDQLACWVRRIWSSIFFLSFSVVLNFTILLLRSIDKPEIRLFNNAGNFDYFKMAQVVRLIKIESTC